MSAPRPDIDGIFLPDKAVCELCGEPMPAGEEMFQFHGYSGPCPKPPTSAPRPEGMSEERLKEIAADAEWLDAHAGVIAAARQQKDLNWHDFNAEDVHRLLHIARRQVPDLLQDNRRLLADGATLKTRADEALAAHSASFGALQTLSAALFDGEVDDYAALAEKIIGRVRQAEADGATLRERVEAALTDSVVRDAAVDAWQANDHEFFDPPTFRHRILKAIFPASAPKEPMPHAVRETGWLIEHSQEGLLKYWSPSSTEHRTWVIDPWQAVRFSRREDAERVKVALNYAFSAVIEHAFMPKEPTP